MPRTDVTQMPFAALYPLLVRKAEQKGRTRQEVEQVVTWLTGYSPDDIARLACSDIPYAAFFQNAPAMNPDRTLICRRQITAPPARAPRRKKAKGMGAPGKGKKPLSLFWGEKRKNLNQRSACRNRMRQALLLI